MTETCKLENINYTESIPSPEKGVVSLNYAMQYNQSFEHDKNDPRLISGIRNQTLILDRDSNEFSCGKQTAGYGGYKDLNVGQINYYVDMERCKPYQKPNFFSNSNVVSYNYTTPMFTDRKYFERIPIEKEVSPYSFINDTNYHREDILGRQMSKMNDEKFTC